MTTMMLNEQGLPCYSREVDATIDKSKDYMPSFKAMCCSGCGDYLRVELRKDKNCDNCKKQK